VLNKYHQDIVEEIFADENDLIVILKGSNVWWIRRQKI
jgi:hypothetical protein